MPETDEGGARSGQQPQHGRADYQKRADREATLQLSSIVWEGNTLVIDVTNVHPKTNYRGSRETLHLIERDTRTSVDRLRYEVSANGSVTLASDRR
jgi:hypothetical protein